MEVFKDMALSIGPILLTFLMPVLFILILRWLGAWMFRITEVIKLQKEILEELKKMNLRE